MKPKPSYKPNISYYYSTQIITIRHQIFSLSKTPHYYCYSRTFFCGIPWTNRHLSNHKMAYVMLKRQSMIKSIGGQSWRRFASVAVGTDLVSAAPNVSLQKARTWDEGVSSNFSTTPLSDIFKGKKVVIFGLPGAFTGVCTAQHVPSYKKNIDKFKAKGVDSVICVSVNDPYTMNGWAEKLEAKEAIEFYGDFDGKFHKSLDLELDLSSALLGHRSTRWSAFVEDGKVKALNVENVPSDFKVSGGEVILGQI